MSKKLLEDFPRGVPGRDKEKLTAPNAQWMDPEEITRRYAYRPQDGNRLFLGLADGNHYIGVEDSRHILVVAGSRGGKGVSSIIPNLLTYRGSVLVMDPKGELARITARQRAEGLKQKVFILDPFGVSGKGGKK